MGRHIGDEELVSVRNRNNGTTFYDLKERKIFRSFSQNERKKVPFGELSELLYTAGGEYILRNLLVVEDKDALSQLGIETEPEYQYDENDIRKVLFEGSLDQVDDFLHFAPEGAIQLAKDIAINEALPDIRKRNMISERLGFNINKAIEIKAMMQDGETEQKEEKNTARKAALPGRKTAAPEYKVVATKEEK